MLNTYFSIRPNNHYGLFSLHLFLDNYMKLKSCIVLWLLCKMFWIYSQEIDVRLFLEMLTLPCQSYKMKSNWHNMSNAKDIVLNCLYDMDRVKRIWYLSHLRAAKVQASLRIRAVSPEPSLLAHTSSESRGTFRQKARSLAPLNGWACAVKVCHDGMLEDTNSLDGAHIY